MGDVVSVVWLGVVSGEGDGLGSPGGFEEDEGAVVAMVAGRLRSRLGSKRRARRAMGLGNFSLGNYCNSTVSMQVI